MPEPTAAEQIDRELQKRQAQYALWFPEDVDVDDTDALPGDGPTAAQVLEFAQEQGYTPGPRYVPDAEDVANGEEEEDPDEYRQTVHDEAIAHIVDQRDQENAMENTVLGFSMQVTVTARIDLSTGGPGDYITAEYDPSDGTLDDVTYHFVPWFDHADVPVPDGSPLYRLMERFTSAYDGMGIDEIAPRD